MARSRFVQLDTRRLTLSDGDWLEVKTRLSIGGLRALQVRKYEVDPKTGTMQLRLDALGIVDVAAYLVDWSFADLPIRGASLDVIEAAVRNLDPDDFVEVEAAVDTHVAAVATERAALKKTSGGGPASPPISPSLVAVAGATSG